MSGTKIAIVTGASSGMGREMVYLLADHFAALEEIWAEYTKPILLEDELLQMHFTDESGSYIIF